MSKSLYLECGSGISGDMTVAALLDLGADREVLEKSLESLKLPGYEIAITRVKKSGLDACDFNVILDAEHENHDHDMAYLHGDGVEVHDHPHDHEHHHDHEHAHSHDHDHTGEHHHHHEHRGLPEILAIIRSGGLTPGARALAERIFQILAEAEAKPMACRLIRCISMRWELSIPSWILCLPLSAWITWRRMKSS